MSAEPEVCEWPVDMTLLAGRPAAEVRLALRELVRGLVIAASMDGTLLPLSPELDAVWLALLAAPGGHERLNETLPKGIDLVHLRTSPTDTAAALQTWIARYVSLFGPMPRAVIHYWPAARWLAGIGVDPCAIRP